jgi:aminoglycoside/choline kinase family phosphotransferase
MNREDPRAAALESWALGWLASQNRWPEATGSLLTVSGDASFRRYFRLPLQVGSLIAVDAPPEKENSRPFVAIAHALRAHGVQVPQVVAVDFEQGFMLLSDLGDTLLLGCLNPDTVDGLYGQALDALLHLQDCKDVPGYPLPPYDRRRLLDEMGLFRDWFIGSYLGMVPSDEDRDTLNKAFATIADAVLAQPQVFVHRDYHSRNLMLLADGSIGVIDFQDAVTGPVTYDLLSLLRDAYIVWPDAQVQGWVAGFAEQLRQQGKLDGVDNAEFQRWFDWMGAQRHLKVVGIFARLSLRDGKHGYLDDIPRVFNYLVNEIAGYPEFAELTELLHGVILPAYFALKPDARAFFTGA